MTPRNLLAALAFGLASLGGMVGPAAAASDPAESAHVLLHLLDYIAVDYPEFVKDGFVLDRAEYDEQVEFAGRARDLLDGLPPKAERAALIARAEALRRAIETKRPGPEVAELAGELRWAIIGAYRVTVSPRRAPDLAPAPALYATHCAVCHGAEGRGDGPAAPGMDPAPSNFTDRARMDQRSVYGLYSTITLGVDGTKMTSFRALTDDQRWALALWVTRFAADPAAIARGEAIWKGGQAKDAFRDLASVVTRTPAETRAKHGDEGTAALAFLRTQPGLIDAGRESPIDLGERLLVASVAAYRAGRRGDAERLAVTAYLDGFELVEATLDTLDRDLRVRTEAEFTRLRGAISAGAPAEDVERQAARVSALLGEARERLEKTALSAGTAFAGAFVILVREGLEALLIVAAIVAFLLRAGRRDTLRYVHAGWVAAVALGLVTWAVASYVIAIGGAHREILEGVAALLAAAVLLYVGAWMHDKAYTARWTAYLERRLRGALAGHTAWALAGVSFLAVYREMFETVLFTEALWLQAGADGRRGVLAGLGAAVLVLGLLVWLILWLGVHLPVGWVFGGSSALLALLAVVLAGQGVAALQEAGVVSVNALDLPAAPALGIHPTAESLSVQLALLVAILGVFAWTHRAARRTA
jgi:high-affinity iron transporter